MSGDYAARYAIYWAPESEHRLAQAAAAWLAQDGAPVREPALYGFHATLKPPFRLADGYSEADLLAATQALARRRPSFAMPALQLAWLQGFLALRPTEALAPDHALWRLADTCVTELDHLRRPPDPAELNRRRAAGLDAEQEDLLLRWGYPHLLQRWRFHMTLSDNAYAGRRDSPPAQALHARLEALLAPALAWPLRCDSICVFRQAEPGRAFESWRRLGLAHD